MPTRTSLSRKDGMLLLIGTIATASFLLFWLLVSKLLPPTDNWVIEWMRQDRYYCILVPIVAVPMNLFANYIRWVSLSLAKGGPAPGGDYVPVSSVIGHGT